MNANIQRSHLNASLALKDHAIESLATHAREIRRLSIAAIYHATSGHPGGSLSCADILATLFGTELKLDRANLGAPDRNRFVLSKGHAAPALYATWASFGLMDAKTALSLRKLGSVAHI